MKSFGRPLHTVKALFVSSVIFVLTSLQSVSYGYDQNSPAYYAGTVIVNNNVQVTVEVLGIVKTCNSWGFHYGFVVRVKSQSMNNTPYNLTYNLYFYSSSNTGHAYGGAYQLSNTSENNIYQVFNNGFQVNCTNMTGAQCMQRCENFTVLDANPTSFRMDYWAPNGSVTGNLGTPLNITLKDFSLQNKNGANLVHWSVDKKSETGIDHYLLERSNDGYNWTELDNVSPGTSDTYNYTDRTYGGEINYYKLSTVNFEGTTEVLRIGYINDGQLSSDFKLYNMYGYEVDEYYKGVVIKRYSNGSVEKFFR